MPTEFVMSIYYIEDIDCKKINIFVTEEKTVCMYLSKRWVKP